RLAILGANGAGKTTLLLHLNGTLRPLAGRVLLDGVPAAHGRADLASWRRRVGLVLQDPDDQLFAATVFEDVSFGPLNMGLDEAAARSRVESALGDLRIAELAERAPHSLSFGQRKRAAIAGVVAMRPEVLLLDEPTAGLDAHGTRHLLAVLDHLVGEGATLVFSTHDADLACAWADEVAVFGEGVVLAQGAPDSVLADRALLGRAKLRPPFALELGLEARALGLLDPAKPLPRRRDEVIALLRGLKPG
ncbi:MAG: ABC transporter ATP-binding protein, partial [Alphaproteobacteria bacterium]|nr:ABC transporter ATP-binding protein [Alphaproteobacteria bacterium]